MLRHSKDEDDLEFSQEDAFNHTLLSIINQDEAECLKLIKDHTNFDTVITDSSKHTVTPIMLLAKQGDIDSILWFLKRINNHRSHIEYAAFGYVLGGYFNAAEKLIKEHGIEVSKLMEFYRQGNHLVSASSILKILANTIDNNIRKNIYDEIEKYLYLHDTTSFDANTLKNILGCATQINQIMQKYGISYNNACQYVNDPKLQKRISKSMAAYSLTFKEAFVWETTTDLRSWLFCTNLLMNNNLSLDFIIESATFMCDLDHQALTDLYNKIDFVIMQTQVHDHLSKGIAWMKFFPNDAKSDKQKLLTNCDNAKTKNELRSILENQDHEDPFYKLFIESDVKSRRLR